MDSPINDMEDKMRVVVRPKLARQGFTTYIPVCDMARMVAELTRQKTLSQAMIRVLKNHKIEVVEEK